MTGTEPWAATARPAQAVTGDTERSAVTAPAPLGRLTPVAVTALDLPPVTTDHAPLAEVTAHRSPVTRSRACANPRCGRSIPPDRSIRARFCCEACATAVRVRRYRSARAAVREPVVTDRPAVTVTGSGEGPRPSGGARDCANPTCAARVPVERARGARYCSDGCAAAVRKRRYRASERGRAVEAAYRAARRGTEAARSAGRRRQTQRRRAAALDARAERLAKVQAVIAQQVPRTTAAVGAQRAQVDELHTRVLSLRAQRDSAFEDAHQLARLARWLFLTTGAPGFTSPGIQALLGAHLSAADRREVPPAYATALDLDVDQGTGDDRDGTPEHDEHRS